MSKEIEEMKTKLTTPSPKKPHVIPSRELLSTGSTLVNLACSGRIVGGLAKGHYYFFVGDSQSGKTMISHNSLAEASINKNFDEYRLIYDNPENGALMDLEKFFGKKLAERIEPPAKDENGEPIHSNMLEEFYYNLDDAKSVGRPFIYVLDSMDALDDRASDDKFQEQKEGHRNGKKVAGSYNMNKAKLNSSNLRKFMNHLSATGSILLIINQTRDNIGSMWGGKTRSGGHALRFYATVELWSSIIGPINKTVNGKPRHIGNSCKIHVVKNRVNGHDVSVTIPIYRSVGIDDIGSCVDYLVEEKHWSMPDKGGVITAKDMDLSGRREKIIEKIEAGDLEDDVRLTVQRVWASIQEECNIKRKSRYS